jgi:hypothetical protein
MINETTKKMFQYILDNGEVRYTDMIRFRIEVTGGTYDHQSSDRGYWSRGIRYHVSVGNLRIRQMNGRSMYSLTERGMGYLDQPTSPTNSEKLISQIETEIESRKHEISVLKRDLVNTQSTLGIVKIVRTLDWVVNRVKHLETELDNVVNTQLPPHEIEFTYTETVLEKRRGSIEVPHEVYLKGERAIEEYIQRNEDDIDYSDMVDCEVSDTLNNISIESL